MPPKAKLQAPIDRPLSRAYLREFGGWSTAYPPGLSDPTTLRIMENVQINRDGSARVRPGLRYMSYEGTGGLNNTRQGIANQIVGTHEVFFMGDGTKGLLFAVREDDGTVGFRVLNSELEVLSLTDAGFATLPAGLNFTAGTTYVKYLQIDNKIFALSNNGETMRMFFVGSPYSVKVLQSIDVPAWAPSDKLDVVHPDADWVNDGIPVSVEYNYFRNPDVANYGGMSFGQYTAAEVISPPNRLRVSSRPQRTNWNPFPLGGGSLAGWSNGAAGVVSAGPSNTLRVTASTAGTFYANGSMFDIPLGYSSITVAGDISEIVGGIGVGWLVRFYSSGGVQIGGDQVGVGTGTAGRWAISFSIPGGAARMQIFASGTGPGGAGRRFDLKHVTATLAGESSSWFSGADGADYFWAGTPWASPSYYHPPATVQVTTIPYTNVTSAQWWYGCELESTVNLTATLLAWEDGAYTSAAIEALVADTPERVAGPVTHVATDQAQLRIQATLPRGEFLYVSQIMITPSASLTEPAFFSGASTDSATEKHQWVGGANISFSTRTTYAVGNTIPTANTPTADTLISSVVEDNTYNFGFFYTFHNEVGESAASQASIVRTQRGWSMWRWETADVDGAPSGVSTTDPALTADQLVASIPSQAIYDAAKAQGALGWTLYMFTWSDQASVPSTAVRVATREFQAGGTYGSEGWLRATPVVLDAMDDFAALPTNNNRYNYSDPSRGGQGLVAADRMVMVYDPTAAAVIRWSANQQGDYFNFTAAKGGGYKTLTSGNLYIPACVKLWQNPQSVDTLTVLCLGVDSYSTSYYMMPAEVGAQSENVQIMGFEETTATPGTTSPYGVEVFNNALYHPLDDQLMKSTANNYNISHKTQTENIRNMWEWLQSKEKIVSSQHDGRLYYIVHNPYGEVLEAGCNGNEMWVYDAQAETGTWSRWLIQAVALRKIEQGGKIYMSVVRPDGIYFLDPEADLDQYLINTLGSGSRGIGERPIPWRLETNTQGANRAHDAWAHVQQANVTFGRFTGSCKYGVRGWTSDGKPLEIAKVYESPHGKEVLVNEPPFDHEDMLLIQRNMKEWFFFAESNPEGTGVARSFGQINIVQYRYTPVSVNIGYEYGSVETFEYGHASADLADRTNINGIPIPALDARRP